MAATDQQPHPELATIPAQSLADLERWYNELLKLKPQAEALDQFLETAISYLQCLYRCYQDNAPKNLDKVKPFFEKVLLAIDGGIFKDTGANAYARLRQGELQDYLPEIYNSRLVLDQLHMLLNEFAKGPELQDSTTSWFLRKTLGFVTRAEGSTWLPRTSILKRIPDEVLPIVNAWHDTLGLHQEATATYQAMLAYRCMPEIRANFERQFSDLKASYTHAIEDLTVQVKALETANKAESERVKQEFNVAKKTLEQASKALETQLRACIHSINQQSPSDQQLPQDATMQDVTQHMSTLLARRQEMLQTAIEQHSQLIMGVQAILRQRAPTFTMSDQPSNEEVLAALQSHLTSDAIASAPSYAAVTPYLSLMQRGLVGQRVQGQQNVDPQAFADRLKLQFQ